MKETWITPTEAQVTRWKKALLRLERELMPYAADHTQLMDAWTGLSDAWRAIYHFGDWLHQHPEVDGQIELENPKP